MKVEVDDLDDADDNSELSPSSPLSPSHSSITEPNFLNSESVLVDGLDGLQKDVLGLFNSALKTRKSALISMGALDPNPHDYYPSKSDLSNFRDMLLEANRKLMGAKKLILATSTTGGNPTNLEIMKNYVDAQLFYNISLSLNDPESDSVWDPDSTGGLAILDSFVKFYDFDKFFHGLKQLDNLDYFLSGVWLSTCIFHYENVDLLKKYRGKAIVAMQKLGLRSHFDYASGQ